MFILLMHHAAMSQYDYAIGVRAGGTTGITLKRNFNASGVELLVGFWNDGLSFTGVYQRQVPAFNQDRMFWFYGWGAHLSVYGKEFNEKEGPAWFNHPNSEAAGEFGFGIDGAAGLEYAFESIPFAVSAGIKPYVEVVTNGAFLFWIDPGVGLKFIF